mmetsp:Transcript_154172/g.295866  ORF Transcript_154172/g.295866 Transcript_154172/m.295866 type:complete len:288 (+) Transcript_154172:70-933(+)
MELLTEGVTGGIGGLVGRSTAFPFDTLKVRLATMEVGTTLGDVLKQIMAEGLSSLYRGLPFSAFEAMYQKFLYVLFYAYCKSLSRRLTSCADPPALANVLSGYFSDLACVPFSMPIEAMVVQLQSAPPSASRAAIVRQALLTREGLLKSLKSGRAYFVLSLKPGIEFAVFDHIKSVILEARAEKGQRSANLSSGTAFALGAVARAIGTVVVYPYARGKAMSQAQLAPTAFAALVQVFRTEGILAMYRGLTMELLRGVTQAAVMFMVMEKLRAAVRRMLLPAQSESTA